MKSEIKITTLYLCFSYTDVFFFFYSTSISLPSDADLSGMNSPASRNMSQMANNSDDEERNELLKLLQEASSDEDNDDDANRSQDNEDEDDVDDDDVDIEGDENEDFDTG